MKFHAFARRLSPILTAYLLVVSLGLPLHKVYCACKGMTDFSLFSTTHACGHDEAVLADEVAMSSCCTDKDATACSFDSVDEHDCGDAETILAKLTTDYILSENDDQTFAVQLLVLPPFTPVYTPLFTAIIPKVLPIRGPDPPPLPYGRELLLRQQLYLC